MKHMILLNDPPYGTRAQLQWPAHGPCAGQERPGGRDHVFLMAVRCSAPRPGRKTPDGYYNLERMLSGVCCPPMGTSCMCRTCMDARGLQGRHDLREQRSTMDELAEATLAATKLLRVLMGEDA